MNQNPWILEKDNRNWLKTNIYSKYHQNDNWKIHTLANN